MESRTGDGVIMNAVEGGSAFLWAWKKGV